MIRPGRVVFVPFVGALGTKNRPAIVVCTDLYLTTRPDLVVGLVTTDIFSATQPTDYVLQDWATAGLRHPSAFRGYFLTLHQSAVIAEFGDLTDRDWQEVQARLRLALAVT